jgi:hypothetical protein
MKPKRQFDPEERRQKLAEKQLLQEKRGKTRAKYYVVDEDDSEYDTKHYSKNRQYAI